MSWSRVQRGLEWRWRSAQPNFRAMRGWRGQSPRVYLHNIVLHPVWDTYLTHPPLQYAPRQVSELCHWVNIHLPKLDKPHVFELEHVAALASYADGRFMHDWFRVNEDNEAINEYIARDECRRVFSFSAGLVEHFKQFVRPSLWPKLDFVYPAFPSQPAVDRTRDAPFNILVIASRFSDKGIPEAIETFRILRERHGRDVTMDLVSQSVPADYSLPEGITIHTIPRLNPDLKRSLYQGADVLYLPCYSETAACFTEASAFGVPIVTTRIHHGDEFVKDGVTGYLLETPTYSYSDGFGGRWPRWEDFLAEVVNLREANKFETIIDQSVERLTSMIKGRTELKRMREASRALHATEFSPEARNRKLQRIYADALGH